MGKRIELETIYRPTPQVSMKRCLPAVSVKQLDAVGSAEWLARKRELKAAQMRRWRKRQKEGK